MHTLLQSMKQWDSQLNVASWLYFVYYDQNTAIISVPSCASTVDSVNTQQYFGC